MSSPRWYTLSQLASKRGCTPDYLRQLIARHGLAAHKVGTIWVVERPEAERFLASPHRPPAGSRYDHFAAECPHSDHFVRCDLNDRSRAILKQSQRRRSSNAHQSAR